MASGVRTALRGRGRGPRRCSVRAEGAVRPGAEPRGHTALPQPKRPREALGSAAVCRGSEPGEPFVAGLDPGVFSGGVRSLVFQPNLCPEMPPAVALPDSYPGRKCIQQNDSRASPAAGAHLRRVAKAIGAGPGRAPVRGRSEGRGGRPGPFPFHPRCPRIGTRGLGSAASAGLRAEMRGGDSPEPPRTAPGAPGPSRSPFAPQSCGPGLGGAAERSRAGKWLTGGSRLSSHPCRPEGFVRPSGLETLSLWPQGSRRCCKCCRKTAQFWRGRSGNSFPWGRTQRGPYVLARSLSRLGSTSVSSQFT